MKSQPNLFYIFILLCLSSSTSLTGQDIINLKNPSFEDTPRKGSQGMPDIKSWEDCGRYVFPRESPPDILPTVDQGWGITKTPSDGKTYMSMVVRATDTWESVTQYLLDPLKAGKCYAMSAMLSMSETYNSRTLASLTNETESFVRPVIFRIWGGQTRCSKKQLLAESPPVENFEWQRYEFVLSPTEDYIWFTIEVYYAGSGNEKYNGHMLIDDLSPIVEIQCE